MLDTIKNLPISVLLACVTLFVAVVAFWAVAGDFALFMYGMFATCWALVRVIQYFVWKDDL